MKKFTYNAAFYKEQNGYSVLFADFAGGTCGNTLEDAQRMAVDFLYANLISLKEENETFPTPTKVADISFSTDFEYESAFLAPVSVDMDKYALYLESRNKSVRKNVTIPLWLAEVADKEHINFSSVLQEALKRQLDI